MSWPVYLIVSFVLGTYLLGSISFAQIFSALKGIDLRKVGSGNLGATNVYRNMGFGYAFLVFILDAIKGFVPVYCVMNLYPTDYYFHIGLGLVAIIGHSLSVFAQFKGGKGAATGLGVLAAINPLVFGILFVLALTLIKLTRYVAPVTILCALLAPGLLFLLESPYQYVLSVSGISIFIIWRHRANISRLLAGTENRV